MMRRKAAAFTLLEVLAAVLILGLSFMILATGATQGLRAEGTAKRRLEASLLADTFLAGLEAQWSRGAAPPREPTEREAGPFVVRIDGIPLDLEALLAPAGGARPTRPGQSDPLALLTLTAGANNPLVEVTVEVAWSDGVDERSVIRRTYAIDSEIITAALEAAGVKASTATTGILDFSNVGGTP